MFRVADEVEPQRSATISSSNMKPVKWVWWLPLSYKYEDDPSYQIVTQTWSPVFKFHVDWRVSGLYWLTGPLFSLTWLLPITFPFK